MSIYVGDPIMKTRQLGPDPCGTLPAPVAPTVTTAAGGSLTGTIYLVQTWRTPWGETTPSPEVVQAMGGNGTLQVANVVPPGATKMRTYIGVTAGQESQYQEYDLIANSVNAGSTATMSISSVITSIGGIPPTYASAYLPDSDGAFMSSGLAFQWLNDALGQMVVQLGGIDDISGVAWPSGAAWQVLQNRWVEIQNFWWQGWWQVCGQQSYTWLVNPIQSIPGYYTPWSSAGQDIVGLWPQPGASFASTTLSGNMGLTDNVININPISVTDGQVFTMPGLVQVDSEFMLISYTNNAGTQIGGVIRGVSGTVAATHNSGAALNQLVAMFTGKRLPPQFLPGSAYALLQLPAGWDIPIDRYMLARFREKEQEHQEAQRLDAEWKEAIEMLRSSRDAVPKLKQVGDSRVFEAFAGYRSSFPFSILFP